MLGGTMNFALLGLAVSLAAAAQTQESAPSRVERARILLEANCGDCLNATRQGLEEAIVTARAALESGDPNKASLLRVLAEAYNILAYVHATPDSAGQRDLLARRTQTLQELVRLDPGDADSRYELAVMRAEPELRISALREMLAVHPGHEEARAALAMTLIDHDAAAEGAALLRELIVGADSENGTLYRSRLYGALLHLGRRTEAGQVAAQAGLDADSAVQNRFIGEVSHGDDFEREFRPGLLFRLAASRDPQTPGWTIEVRSTADPNPEAEFSWPVTPPHRFFNPRYLQVSYGFSAAQLVVMDERQFSFVQNAGDYAVAAQSLRTLLWPGTASTEEIERAQSALDKIPVCTGVLRIRAHRLAADPAAEQRIAWLKFEVELQDPREGTGCRASAR
jgi:hypothetical protein